MEAFVNEDWDRCSGAEKSLIRSACDQLAYSITNAMEEVQNGPNAPPIPFHLSPARDTVCKPAFFPHTVLSLLIFFFAIVVVCYNCMCFFGSLLTSWWQLQKMCIKAGVI